jgi:hypothetical protein
MVCNCLKRLDSGFRRNDGKKEFPDFLRDHQYLVYIFLDTRLAFLYLLVYIFLDTRLAFLYLLSIINKKTKPDIH